MKRLLICLSILLSGSTFASTQQEEITSLKKRIKSLEAKQTTNIKADSSRGNRQNLKYGFELGTGVSFSELGTQLNANYFYNSKNVIFISSFFSSDARIYDNDQTFEDETFALSAGVKLYTGNSFFVKPSIFYRTIKEYEYYSEYFDQVDESGYKEERLKDLGISLAIGNQWQWEHFTVGFDWIGISRQVTTFKEVGYNSFFNINSEKTTFTFLNTYIGLNF